MWKHIRCSHFKEKKKPAIFYHRHYLKRRYTAQACKYKLPLPIEKRGIYIHIKYICIYVIYIYMYIKYQNTETHRFLK